MSKPILQLFLILILTGQQLFAQKGKQVRFKVYPRNLSAFENLRSDMARTPQGGAAIYLLALKIYAEEPELGIPCLIQSTDRANLYRSNEPGNYRGWKMKRMKFSRIRSQLKRYPELPNSFFKGSQMNNGYIPELPLRVDLQPAPSWEIQIANQKKFYLRSSGDEGFNSRSITVRKNSDGVWYAIHFEELMASFPNTTTVNPH